ncbi:UNVERIFIED_CONTAM: NAP1- protein 2 [Gekko kuhli]
MGLGRVKVTCLVDIVWEKGALLGFFTQSCGGRLNSKDAGYITSPGYPQDYPSHQNCEWIIYAPEPNQKIILNFNPHFEIEKHDCK